MNKEVKLYLSSSDSHGCGLMRVKQPAEFLKQHLNWVEYSLGFPPNDPRLEEAEIIGLQRANNEFFQTWIPRAKAVGKKIISDMDDNLWGIPASNLAHVHYPTRELKKLDYVMKNSDALTCSTIPLAEFLKNRFGVEPIVIPNMYHTPREFVKPKNEKLRIGWHGSYTHAGDFDHYLVNALKDLKKKYDFEFHTFGYCPIHLKEIAIHTEWADIDNFMNTLIGLNLDIGLIVAADNHFNRCKSNLKYIEYSLAKTVSIAANVYPYATTIEDQVDGFLAKNPKKDWYSYLEEMIVNETLRLEVSERANDKVKKNYTFEGNGDLILSKYDELFTRLGLK